MADKSAILRPGSQRVKAFLGLLHLVQFSKKEAFQAVNRVPRPAVRSAKNR